MLLAAIMLIIKIGQPSTCTHVAGGETAGSKEVTTMLSTVPSEPII